MKKNLDFALMCYWALISLFLVVMFNTMLVDSIGIADAIKLFVVELLLIWLPMVMSCLRVLVWAKDGK